MTGFRTTLLAGAAVLASAATASGASNILFILDSSNSMWGQIEGIAKIETAKNALGKLLSDLPADTQLGLMVYGHREEGSCRDVELVLPLGHADPADIQARLAAIVPKGKTPMAYSIEQSATAFGEAAEGANNVVLISDGIESCGGDPCAAAGKLAAAGIGVRVHVVGFDISEEDRAQLECIAERGGGRYFPADGTEDFTIAVAEAVQAAQAEPEPAPEPEPAGPVRERVFFDDFDAIDLSEDWTVHNADPNAYLVEAGNLLLLSNVEGGFRDPGTANILELERDLPEGDWDAHLRFTGELKTGKERISFGLRQDEANYMYAAFWTDDRGTRCFIGASLYQRSGGQGTNETEYVGELNGRGCDGNELRERYEAITAGVVEKPATLTLSKRGRSYSASLQMEGHTDDNGEPIVYRTDSLTSLRTPGKLTLAIGKHAARNGEMLIMIDSVEVETVKEPTQ